VSVNAKRRQITASLVEREERINQEGGTSTHLTHKHEQLFDVMSLSLQVYTDISRSEAFVALQGPTYFTRVKCMLFYYQLTPKQSNLYP